MFLKVQNQIYSSHLTDLTKLLQSHRGQYVIVFTAWVGEFFNQDLFVQYFIQVWLSLALFWTESLLLKSNFCTSGWWVFFRSDLCFISRYKHFDTWAVSVRYNLTRDCPSLCLQSLKSFLTQNMLFTNLESIKYTGEIECVYS